jgi:hypothetical protein
MIFEWDDFGCDRVISDQCQSHDCRDQLMRLKELNPKFKATLFAIPAEMTPELLGWCSANADWIEVAQHGFLHNSNYEVEKMNYEDFNALMEIFSPVLGVVFKHIFRAPGWQISDDVMKWLQEKGWILCDQGYNDERRPKYINAYINYDGHFQASPKSGNPVDVEAYHGHTWNVGWNGIYEDYPKVEGLVKEAKEFKFVSELFT